MSLHTITTTLQRVYTPKKGVLQKLILTGSSDSVFVYVGKDEKAMTDYGYLGAELIVSLYQGAIPVVTNEPLYALSTSGTPKLGIMEV